MSKQTKQQEGKIEKTGINKAIDKDLPTQDFKDKVVCKKCGKVTEYTKGVKMYTRCPLCNEPLERDLVKEEKEGKAIIKYSLLRRSKRYFIYIGLVLTAISIAYNVIGFFTQLFDNGFWWLALMSLPLVIISAVLSTYARFKSSMKRYRFMSWLIVVINIVALAAIAVTAVPYLNTLFAELYAGV